MAAKRSKLQCTARLVILCLGAQRLKEGPRKLEDRAVAQDAYSIVIIGKLVCTAIAAAGILSILQNLHGKTA